MTNSSQKCIQIVPLIPSRGNVCDSLRKSNIFRSLLSSCSSRVHFLYHFFCFHLKALQSLKIFPKIRELSPLLYVQLSYEIPRPHCLFCRNVPVFAFLHSTVPLVRLGVHV